MQLYFDVTTTAQWGGAPVGIIRVERELARWCEQHRPNVRFCVYHKARNEFLEIDRALVPQIATGEVTLDFSPAPPQMTEMRLMRHAARDWLLARPLLYQSVQALRGHFTSVEEVELIRKSFEVPAVRPTYADEVTLGAIALDANCAIISGGLDWEHKNVHGLHKLKAEKSFKYFAIVYDLIPLLWPHYVVPFYVDILTAYFGELLWLADGCMCISESTRRDLLAFYDENYRPHPPTGVFHLGSDINKDSADGGALPAVLRDKEYGLFVSTIEPRKNHRTLYEAWDRAVRAGQVSAQKDRLVFVGRKGWAVEEMVNEIRANPATRDTIVILENISDANLAELYHRARFALFPAHYEGYGLPVAEALAYGKASLVSEGGSIPEIDAGAAWRIDAKDVVKWSEAIVTLFKSDEKVAELEARAKSMFKPITWSQSAEKFFATLEGWI